MLHSWCMRCSVLSACWCVSHNMAVRLLCPMQSKVDPYCFIEFYDHRTAEQAIKTMNKEYAFGKVCALRNVIGI